MMLFTTSELDRQTELETTQLQNSFLSWFYITPIWIIEDMPTTVHPILDSPEQSNSQEEIQKANPSDNRYKNYMLRVRLSNGYEWEENVIKAMAHHDEEIAKAMERHKKEYPAPKLC